jgi:hypothetical protein
VLVASANRMYLYGLTRRFSPGYMLVAFGDNKYYLALVTNIIWPWAT